MRIFNRSVRYILVLTLLLTNLACADNKYDTFISDRRGGGDLGYSITKGQDNYKITLLHINFKEINESVIITPKDTDYAVLRSFFKALHKTTAKTSHKESSQNKKLLTGTWLTTSLCQSKTNQCKTIDAPPILQSDTLNSLIYKYKSE